jgi:hypothetical protein
MPRRRDRFDQYALDEPVTTLGDYSWRAPGSFAHPEQFAQATDGGRGGNMSAVWKRNPQPGLADDDPAGTYFT